MNKSLTDMKKLLLTLVALVISATSFAQLIANKTDKKVTLGFDIFSDFQLMPKDNTTNWDARGFNQGASWYITYNSPLGESSKHTVSIGAGMTHHNYFCYNRIINPYSTDTLVISDSYRSTENFRRAKINANYVDIPLELRFRINDQFKIGVGFKLGILFMAKTKYVGPDYTEGSTLTDENGIIVHEKHTYIKNLERYSYSVTLRAGWKWLNAFASYQLNPVFEVGHDAPVIHPLSVGFTIAPF
jgi:hypothetical protein